MACSKGLEAVSIDDFDSIIHALNRVVRGLAGFSGPVWPDHRWANDLAFALERLLYLHLAELEDWNRLDIGLDGLIPDTIEWPTPDTLEMAGLIWLLGHRLAGCDFFAATLQLSAADNRLCAYALRLGDSDSALGSEKKSRLQKRLILKQFPTRWRYDFRNPAQS